MIHGMVAKRQLQQLHVRCSPLSTNFPMLSESREWEHHCSVAALAALSLRHSTSTPLPRRPCMARPAEDLLNTDFCSFGVLLQQTRAAIRVSAFFALIIFFAYALCGVHSVDDGYVVGLLT